MEADDVEMDAGKSKAQPRKRYVQERLVKTEIIEMGPAMTTELTDYTRQHVGFKGKGKGRGGPKGTSRGGAANHHFQQQPQPQRRSHSSACSSQQARRYSTKS